jgi:hypothetical protein
MARKVLGSHEIKEIHHSYCYTIPFRMNKTPDHRVESLGVRLTNTPCGQACLRLELGCDSIKLVSDWA